MLTQHATCLLPEDVHTRLTIQTKSQSRESPPYSLYCSEVSTVTLGEGDAVVSTGGWGICRSKERAHWSKRSALFVVELKSIFSVNEMQNVTLMSRRVSAMDNPNLGHKR